MRKILLILTAVLLTVNSVSAETDYSKVLQKLDALKDFSEMDLSLVWTMVSQKPGEEKSITKIQLFVRDKNDQFTYLFLKPEVDKGQGFFKSGDNAWAYDPTSGKYSHFSMKENIGDTEARNDDVDGYDYYTDYNIESAEPGKLGKIDTHIIVLTAKTNEVATPKLKIWVRMDNNLILKQEDYSLSDRLLRTALFPKWTTIGGRYIYAKALYIDNLKKGEKTQVTISNLSNAKIPDSVFTKDYLKKVNNK